MFYCSVLSTLQSLRLINVIDLVNVDNTNISYAAGTGFGFGFALVLIFLQNSPKLNHISCHAVGPI